MFCLRNALGKGIVAQVRHVTYDAMKCMGIMVFSASCGILGRIFDDWFVHKH